MEQMLDILLIVVGLIICLGGIYFKKAVAGFMGMTCGIELGLILILAFFSYDSDERTTIVMVIALAIIGAILCAVYDQICGAVSAFFNSALATFFVLLFTPLSNVIVVVILVVLLISSIVAYISYLYYRVTFILTTAITGAFLAGIGITDLLYKTTPAEIFMVSFFGKTDYIAMTLLCTIGLSVVGFGFQWKNGSGIVVDLNNFNNIGAATKEAGHTIEKRTCDVISQIRNTWENYSTEEHIYFGLICGYSFLWPVCWKVTNFATTNMIYILMRTLSLVLAGCVLTLVVYCIYNKDKVFNIACVAALVLGNLFWQRDSVSYFGISGWINVLLYLIIALALYIIKEKLKGVEKLIWKLLFSALAIQTIIIPLVNKILIGYAGFSFWNIIQWGAAILMLAFLTGDYDVTGAIKKHKNGAIAQIKNKDYVDALKEYRGNLLLVGVNYDKQTKHHTCMIEKISL